MRWTVVRRYIGNLAPALKDVYGDAAFAKLAEILGAADGYPELKAKPALHVGRAAAAHDQPDRSKNREREDAHPRQHPPATKPGAIPPTRESQLDPASVAPLLRHEGCSLGPTLEVQLR